MKTAVELAMEKSELLEPIPRMTDPLSRSWDQPRSAERKSYA